MSGGHLPRLERVWIENPTYFITTCTHQHRRVLTNLLAFGILKEEWQAMRIRTGWAVGRFVVMPDHVHFFVRPPVGHGTIRLTDAIGRWKQWTSKRIGATGISKSTLWQPGFFDHVMRSSESESEKWAYVVANPVRAGLVESAEEWPYQGAGVA